MRTNSTEDEDEYEDAMESPLPEIQQQHQFVFVEPRTNLGTPKRPANLNIGPEWTRPFSMPARPQSSAAASNSAFHTPRPASTIFSTPGTQSARDSSSHRDRLVTLRRRMNNEFGNRDVTGTSGIPDFEVDDTLSTMSEAPSLQSWHQQIINKNETVVVNASDTMSTCAMSIAPSFNSEYFEHFKSPQPPHPNLVNQQQQSSDRNPSRKLTADSDESSITLKTPAAPQLSPCPKMQPPPIPSREHVMSPNRSAPLPPIQPPPIPQRVPPPLPPRNPAMKLPNPISIEVENRILANENDAEKSKFVTRTGRSVTLPTIPSQSSSLNKDLDETTNNESNLEWQKSPKVGESAMTSSPSSMSNISKEPAPQEIKKSPAATLEAEAPCTSRSFVSIEAVTSPKTCEARVARSVSNDELKNHRADTFDPITLDVERRLSMKRNGQLPEDHISVSSSEDNVSRLSVARSGIGHATHFARNSVIYASGKIMGAFRKVKGARNTGTLSNRSAHGEESSGDESDAGQTSHQGHIVRPRKSKKGPFDFEHLTLEQELDNEHTGAVWCIKFSICGRLMATAGQDSILRIWVVKSHLKYFSEVREKYANNLDEVDDHMNPMDNIEPFRPPSSMDSAMNSDSQPDEDSSNMFCSKPFAVLKGHTADVLDVSWSKNYFILSSGMDRTVKLWHLSRNECLCCFQHIDFVTCVAFLPKDDRYFLSGSLDGKLRLWHIPDKKVAVWNEVQVKFITAMTFVKNGKFVVVGTYNGRCYFYTTDQLKYHTVVDVRSTRGRNAKGHKVTGLAVHGDKLLVTSNDSRIRMYDIRDKALTCKFKGFQNDHSQIRAAFSPDGRHIICGSEDKFIYLWRSSDVPSSLSVRKDRNSMWERIQSHNVSVSAAVFAPRPQVFLAMLEKRDKKHKGDPMDYDQILAQSDSIQSNGNITVAGHAVVSADLQGVIKVFVNRPRQCKVAPTGFSQTATSTLAV